MMISADIADICGWEWIAGGFLPRDLIKERNFLDNIRQEERYIPCPDPKITRNNIKIDILEGQTPSTRLLIPRMIVQLPKNLVRKKTLPPVMNSNSDARAEKQDLPNFMVKGCS